MNLILALAALAAGGLGACELLASYFSYSTVSMTSIAN